MDDLDDLFYPDANSNDEIGMAKYVIGLAQHYQPADGDPLTISGVFNKPKQVIVADRIYNVEDVSIRHYRESGERACVRLFSEQHNNSENTGSYGYNSTLVMSRHNREVVHHATANGHEKDKHSSLSTLSEVARKSMHTPFSAYLARNSRYGNKPDLVYAVDADVIEDL